jgi:hypothetical protein
LIIFLSDFNVSFEFWPEGDGDEVRIRQKRCPGIFLTGGRKRITGTQTQERK